MFLSPRREDLSRRQKKWFSTRLGANESSRHSPALGPQRHKLGVKVLPCVCRLQPGFGLGELCRRNALLERSAGGEGCKLGKESFPRAQGQCLHGKKTPRSYMRKKFTSTGLL